MSINYSIAIPTYNAGDDWIDCLKSIQLQTISPRHILVIDSNSTDSTCQKAEEMGCILLHTNPQDFNHGRIRNLCIDYLSDSEFIVFLTQDAVLASEASVSFLLSTFLDPEIGMAYGRQLPRSTTKPIGAHARLFNYPASSEIRSIDDAKRLGIKTAFVSNSYAAYRKAAIEQIGGFPSNVILSEDTYVAGKMLLANWKISYVANSAVFHAHDYTYFSEFKRYFDTGVFHGRESWITHAFGRSENEGFKFIKSEFKYLMKYSPFLIPSAFFRTLIKYLGYKLGQHESLLPKRMKILFSMHKNFWRSS